MLLPIFIEPVNSSGTPEAISLSRQIRVYTGAASRLIGGRRPEREMRAISKSKKNALIGITAAVVTAYLMALLILSLRIKQVSVYVRSLGGDSESLLYILNWTIVVAGAAALIIELYNGGRLSGRTKTSALAFLMIVQSVFFSTIYIGEAANTAAWMPWITSLENKIDDDEFYRVKCESKIFDVNLIGALGYNTLAHYTSLTKEDYLFAVRNLGYSGYWMEVGSHGGTLITDALLRNKYIIAKDEKFEGELTQVYSNGGYQIYEERDALPFGIVTSAKDERISALPQLERPMIGEWGARRAVGKNYGIMSRVEPNTLENAQLSYDEKGGARKCDRL